MRAKADYTPEMEQIKAASHKDGSFMKAPNGKPTKLTEKQWLHVRTKAFKDWFGDWERKSELSFAATHTGWKQTQNVLHQLKGVALTNIEKGIVGYVN